MIGGKKIVALCTYGIYEPQIFGFISDLNEKITAVDARLFVYAMNIEIGNTGDFYIAEASVYDLIPYDKVDAVVIMAERIKSREVCQKIIDRSNENNIPVIVIDGDYDDVVKVKYDYASGFECVVRHVIEEHKPKRPHFMAGKKNNQFSDERIEVFKKVLKENNMPFDESMVSYGDFWSVPSRAAAHKLLKRDVLPDAIICANDIMAINVTDVLASAGISVPEQVLVSGFDGIDEAFISSPGITTAICDCQMLATTTFEALADAFDKQKPKDRFIVPKFVANESCGCKRCDFTTLSTVHEMNNRFYHHQDDIHIMHNLTAYMMGSPDLDGCAYHIRHSLPDDNLCCVVEDACSDLTQNYFLEKVENTTKSLIYNFYNTKDKIVPYDEDEVIPNLSQILEKGYPLIFNAMEFMSRSIGFVCYSFEKYNLIDYSRTASITNSLSLGFGGYFTMRYQQYLRDEIQKMYQNDALTGLYNRLAFLSKLEELKKSKALDGKTITALMADLNGLKLINDTLGHAAGDRAIAVVAHALKAASPDGSLCVRFGGDEMLSIIVGQTDVEAIVNKIQEELKKATEELGYKVSASFGSYTTEPGEVIDLDRIIGLADQQMYRMKKGRGKFCQ